MTDPISIECLCGAVHIELRGEPAARANCHCGSCCDFYATLFGTNRLDMRVVPNSLVARASGGALPADLSPTMHLFCRHRVVDVADALTKYLDGWDGPEFSHD